MQIRYSIVGLMEFTAVVALIISADRLLLTNYPAAFFALPAIGGLTGAYFGIRLRSGNTFEQIVKSVRLWAAGISLINSLIVGIVIAEGYRGIGYFEWSNDWVEFTLAIIINTLVSIGLGMFLAMVPAAYIASWKRTPTR